MADAGFLVHAVALNLLCCSLRPHCCKEAGSSKVLSMDHGAIRQHRWAEGEGGTQTGLGPLDRLYHLFKNWLQKLRLTSNFGFLNAVYSLYVAPPCQSLRSGDTHIEP